MAIAASAAAATAAAVFLTSTVQTAAALNNLWAGVAEVMTNQQNIYNHFKTGIMSLN